MLNILVNGLVNVKMVRVNNYGLIMLLTKVNGLIIFLKDMVLSKNLIVIYYKVNGKKAGPMGQQYLSNI